MKWRDVEALLLEHYETRTSKEGADAYPALMLLLPAHRAYRPEGRRFWHRSVYDLESEARKGFRLRPVGDYAPEGIPSDPELENQINDRSSFKRFLGLPLDRSSTRSLRRAVPGSFHVFEISEPVE